MTANISCPVCERPVDPQSRICEHCGVDMAVAAGFAERNVHLLKSLPGQGILTPEILVPRLGDSLLEKGLISQEDLEYALKYQQEIAAQGKAALLGQVLRELNFIDSETLDQVITEQILQLQSALRQSNLQLEQRVDERTHALQVALEKLTELNQLKANFIANISHELRTPLTHIKGYLDILRDGGFGKLNEQQQNALNKLHSAELRMENLIEDLIQFSLATRGELSLNIHTVSMKDLVEKVVNGSLPKAQSAGITLEGNCAESLPPVNCDGEKIGWVLQQFVDNALKFTPKGGCVSIEVFRQDESVKVVVRDTGIGIPPERMSEIFEPFHQLDGSTTRRYGGTGLGLALSRHIIEAHDSRITVESEVGKGSAFTIALPIAFSTQNR